MDLRGQDHKRIVLPSSFVYNPPIREANSKVSTASIFSTSGGDHRRRDGTTGNGTSSLFTASQTFDHHHHNPFHQQQQPPQPQPLQQAQPHQQQSAPLPPQSQQSNQARIPDPDPEAEHDHEAEAEAEAEAEPESDPVPVSIAIAGVISAPIAGGSTPRTPTTRTEVSTIRYRECLKNHAASIGGHVVDGCGEFMPGGEEGTPEALKCAACECHRNFHRKEGDGEPQSGANYYYCYNPNSKVNGSRSRILPPSLPAPPIPQPIQHQKFPIGLPTSPHSALMPPMMMAFGGGGGGSAATDSSSEDLNVFHSNAALGGQPQQAPQYGSLSKKRFRTKFSKEQKDKMLEFADKVGWRMQKQDEPAVQQFCAEVGVKRQVLKVWMHNNKHSMKKKELQE